MSVRSWNQSLNRENTLGVQKWKLLLPNKLKNLILLLNADFVCFAWLCDQGANWIMTCSWLTHLNKHSQHIRIGNQMAFRVESTQFGSEQRWAGDEHWCRKVRVFCCRLCRIIEGCFILFHGCAKFKTLLTLNKQYVMICPILWIHVYTYLTAFAHVVEIWTRRCLKNTVVW